MKRTIFFCLLLITIHLKVFCEYNDASLNATLNKAKNLRDICASYLFFFGISSEEDGMKFLKIENEIVNIHFELKKLLMDIEINSTNNDSLQLKLVLIQLSINESAFFTV